MLEKSYNNFFCHSVPIFDLYYIVRRELYFDKKKRRGDSTFEEDLANDVLEIITVFSARLYGSRSHKNKHIIQQLKEVAKELK